MRTARTAFALVLFVVGFFLFSACVLAALIVGVFAR